MQHDEHDDTTRAGAPGTSAPQPAVDAAEGSPRFWRVAAGVLYAELAMSASIRPPLLTEWESERVLRFRNRERRAAWLAGRALVKVLVKDRLGIAGIVDIREGADGEPLLYVDGFPRADIWLGICVRHGKVACVLADRPVSLQIRHVHPHEGELVSGFSTRGELRGLRRLVGCKVGALSAAWAIKEAALRAVRSHHGNQLVNVRIDSALGVDVDGDVSLDVLGLRFVDDVAVAIVGRFLLEEPRTVRIVVDERIAAGAASNVVGAQRLHALLERSVTRARRIADARSRWGQLRPES